MLCEKFSESWFNGEHWVARRKLRPFCLWHWSYLHFIDSPLAPGAEVKAQAPAITWSDIELASRICQLEYPEQLPVRLSFLERTRMKTHLFVTMAKRTEQIEIAKYYAYISDYFAPPSFNEWKTEGDKGINRGGPPDPLSVASACLMLFGGGYSTEKWVWEMPIGKAYWYASTLHYNRGAPLDYMTAKDEAIRKFLRKQRAEGKI